MELKRKMYDILLNWKRTKNQECLLVKGARQIGKTYIIKKFGEENYKSFIYINFIEKPEYMNAFNGNLDADEIYKRLSIIDKTKKIIDKDTLIFLDEIQECPNARTALKFLAIDNRCDVIASGSLLGINYKEVKSYPVGYETQIEMQALDFEEFLWAKGVSQDGIDYIRAFWEKKERVDAFANDKMLEYLREYIVVGGMPKVVQEFIITNNFASVHKMQEMLIDLYLQDIAKYASLSERPKVRGCYLSIPAQLNREYNKFQYSIVEKGGTSRKFGNSLDWLRDANLIKFCYNVNLPEMPLIAYEELNEFKIYLNDIGLLIAMYGYETKGLVLNNELKGFAKGGIYEAVIFDILTKRGYKLNYYKTKDSSMEIEFLMESPDGVIPIEVKAGNGRSISLDNYIKKFNPKYAYKFINGNLGISDTKITLPLYMAMFI